jgi:hypothetical protein
VDFEKAFDSVEREFLIKPLKSFNFGPSICKWFKTLYAESKRCVINNGHMSNFEGLFLMKIHFHQAKGKCHQHTDLSMALFHL